MDSNLNLYSKSTDGNQTLSFRALQDADFSQAVRNQPLVILWDPTINLIFGIKSPERVNLHSESTDDGATEQCRYQYTE